MLEDKGFLSSVYKFNGKYEASGFIFNNSFSIFSWTFLWNQISFWNVRFWGIFFDAMILDKGQDLAVYSRFSGV